MNDILQAIKDNDVGDSPRKACLMAYRALREDPELIHEVDIEAFSIHVLLAFAIKSFGHCSLEVSNEFKKKLRETGRFSKQVCEI